MSDQGFKVDFTLINDIQELVQFSLSYWIKSKGAFITRPKIVSAFLQGDKPSKADPFTLYGNFVRTGRREIGKRQSLQSC